ncbi:MAG: amylo-alpha-1,6-glucosidase [Vicinamibacterales bacterium]
MTVYPNEWLVTNGLGGYASGTIDGPVRRRYHGLLIAALPAPLGRTMLLTQVKETMRVGDDRAQDQQIDETHLEAFGLVDGLPRWRYRIDGVVIEKRVLMPHQRNTVHVAYRCLSGGPGAVTLSLRPIVGFRPHEVPVTETVTSGYSLTIREHRLDISSESGVKADLRFLLHAPSGAFVADHLALDDVHYLIEEYRGYEARGGLWSPGLFETVLTGETPVTLTASTESWESLAEDAPDRAEEVEVARRRELLAAARPHGCGDDCARLVLAADQFVILPLTRLAREARGARARTIIAGYHWFTDWGRDTMISLEGLTLVTGRHSEAAEILRTFAGAERDGLIPNYFPEGDSEGVYHTADATLWFFHAISRYVAHTGDTALVRELMPVLRRILDAHLKGTRFGIGVDTRDGLLTQGAEGYQLTWMDAKVDGWVVTPRRGKAVEINALWYNALRLMQRWVADDGDSREAEALRDHADRAYASFNARFWSEKLGHLFDVVDLRDGKGGDDSACRPNQLFAISLEHPVLDPTHWQAVAAVVEQRLLTPVGLRSLAPGHPDYKPQYFGDLRTRDAAYHQGTVWGWLIGPAVDAWLKTHPGDVARARRLLDGLIEHLDQAGAGSISEVFDAEPPYAPRGCIAQAWSVAEVLRCLWKINAAPSTFRAGR